MYITFYKSSAENIRVDKSNYITGAYAIEGSLRENTSILDPIILVQHTNFPAYYYNYLYISEFKRYYFITDITSVRNDLWQLTCHVDVLFTWRGSLANQLAVVDKSQTDNANLYIDDGSFVLDSRKYIKTIPFNSPIQETGEYILIVAGGAT